MGERRALEKKAGIGEPRVRQLEKKTKFREHRKTGRSFDLRGGGRPLKKCGLDLTTKRHSGE